VASIACFGFSILLHSYHMAIPLYASSFYIVYDFPQCLRLRIGSFSISSSD
jgi:hypothetical protein